MWIFLVILSYLFGIFIWIMLIQIKDNSYRRLKFRKWFAIINIVLYFLPVVNLFWLCLWTVSGLSWLIFIGIVFLLVMLDLVPHGNIEKITEKFMTIMFTEKGENT